MSTKYVITCRCGRKWKVEARQAGEQIACSCGTQVEVPTMRGLLQLPLVADAVEDKPAGQGWTKVQGLCFVAGLAWLAVGAAVTWWLWSLSTRPVEVLRFERDADQLSSRIETLTPSESMVYWRMFREQPARMLDGPRRVREVGVGNEHYVWKTWVAAAVTIIGAGGFAFGLVAGRRKGKTA